MILIYHFNVFQTREKIFFQIDANRKMTTVSCNCIYNKNRTCKHIAATIYYVSNENSLSKFDFE